MWFSDFIDSRLDEENGMTSSGGPLKNHVSDGTTLVAAEYNGGVVVGTDSRTSSGSIVVSRVTDKLTPVTEFIYCLRSGTTAHSQAVADAVKYELSVYEIESGKLATVHLAAQCFRDMCYRYRDDLSMSLIVVGWDPVNGGQIYQVPSGGMIVRQPMAMSGSGPTYVFGYADHSYKEGMRREECEEFVKKAVALAIFRDGGSGGVIRMATFSDKGVEKKLLKGKDIPTFVSY